MKNQTINNDFCVVTLPFEGNLFLDLFQSVKFETITQGRLGSQLVKVSKKGIPLVRSTTPYTTPAYLFTTLHDELLATIDKHLENPLSLHFNHALIEVYNQDYRKMKYHSDQALDLDANGYIGLFSCYENPNKLNEKNIRKLKIKEKSTHKEFEILLTHNSFVLFSVQSNAKYWHKIVLEGLHPHEQVSENRWLGITFRTANTFINFREDVTYLSTGERLNLATEEEKRTYYKLRAEENRSINFNYPKITYTLSQGDLMFPYEVNDESYNDFQL